MTNPVQPPPAPSPRALCGAKTRSGKPCQLPPVQGASRCRMHGGASPQAMTAARQRVLEARVRGQLEARGWDPITDPVAAFADLAGEVWAFKEVLRDKLTELERWTVTNDLTGVPEVQALVATYERSLDRAQKTLTDMLRIGLTAEHLRQSRERPSREQAEIFGRVLDTLLEALDLTPEQRTKVPTALTQALQQEGLLP